MNIFRFILTFAPNGWWHKFPFLPIPPWNYIKFRQDTYYGRKGIRVIPRMILDLPHFYRAWVAWDTYLKAERLWYKAVRGDHTMNKTEQEIYEVVTVGNELADAVDTINEAHADGATPDDVAWDRLEKALVAWGKMSENLKA